MGVCRGYPVARHLSAAIGTNNISEGLTGPITIIFLGKTENNPKIRFESNIR